MSQMPLFATEALFGRRALNWICLVRCIIIWLYTSRKDVELPNSRIRCWQRARFPPLHCLHFVVKKFQTKIQKHDYFVGVGDCLQDLTTNTLTRTPDFFYFIDHRKRSLPARDYKVPFYSFSCSISFITVNHWFGLVSFQSSRLSDSHAWSVTPLYLTFSQITLGGGGGGVIIKTKL